MSQTVIKIENLSKFYRLGVWGTGTLKDDLAKQWARLRGKSDPTASIGSLNTFDTVDQNHVWALKDINLSVQQGEVLGPVQSKVEGIIGKNGAGKSALLKILSQITSLPAAALK